MTTHVLQYDLGLRLWVLTSQQGEVLSSYLSRQSALRDPRVRRIQQDGELRIRNADGTFEPADARSLPVSRKVVPPQKASLGTISAV